MSLLRKMKQVEKRVSKMKVHKKVFFRGTFLFVFNHNIIISSSPLKKGHVLRKFVVWENKIM